MAFRHLTRGLFQLVTYPRLCSSMKQQNFIRKSIFNNERLMPIRSFASVQRNGDAYKDLNQFLEKEIQLEKSAQKHPSKLPVIQGFEVCFMINMKIIRIKILKFFILSSLTR